MKLSAASLFSATLLLALPAGAQFRGPTRPDVALPDGPVREVLLDNCVSCHGIDDYAFHAMARDAWHDFLGQVHEPEVALEEKDGALLLDYLAGNFGTQSIPFPRDYVPPEINEFFGNDDARVFLEGRCVGCHSVERVLGQRHAPEDWRSVLVAERERGAELSDEELEKLTEWLGRVRGTNPFE